MLHHYHSTKYIIKNNKLHPFSTISLLNLKKFLIQIIIKKFFYSLKKSSSSLYKKFKNLLYYYSKLLYRVAYRCLDDFKKYVRKNYSKLVLDPPDPPAPGVNMEIIKTKIFKGLQRKYDNPDECDKIHRAMEKIKIIKAEMSENINKMLILSENLNQCQADAEAAAEEAQEYAQAAADLDAYFAWKDCMATVVLVIVVIVVLAIIGLVLYFVLASG